MPIFLGNHVMETNNPRAIGEIGIGVMFNVDLLVKKELISRRIFNLKLNHYFKSDFSLKVFIVCWNCRTVERSNTL